MRSMNNQVGFTLLELVIVVLVIAILAAVAVPQYQRAVAKSRYKTMYALARAVYTGQEHFYLSHGSYTNELNRLDISAPLSEASDVSIGLRSDDFSSYVLTKHKKLDNTLVVYNEHSAHYPNHVYCEAKADDSLAIWVCEKGLGGTKIEEGSLTQGYTAYVLEGNEGAWEDVAPVIHDPVSYTNDSGKDKDNPLVLEEGDICTASQTNGCKYVDASGAECTANGQNGCSYSSFSEESTCNAGAQGGCFKSQFKDSECHVYAAGNSANSTSCGGSDKWSDESYYDHSKCFNEDSNKNGFGCGRSTYDNESYCQSNAHGGCGNSTYKNKSTCYGEGTGKSCDYAKFYSGSTCEADGPNGCISSEFYGGSTCVALKPKGCSSTTYDKDSYCKGDYCPAGTPKTPEDEQGNREFWHKCTQTENEERYAEGMSC